MKVHITWLDRLLAPFRVPAQRTEPYTLEEVDGPAWHPEKPKEDNLCVTCGRPKSEHEQGALLLFCPSPTEVRRVTGHANGKSGWRVS